MERAATILHADLDAFYASVEQLLDPSLAGKPIAVGGGVVLAASYEAKAFGVQGGMSGRRARELCPGLRFVPGNFREYQRLGDEVMSVLADFTPVVERISIDEAFLEVSGSIHLFGTPAEMADAMRRRAREEIGLPLSIGIARTKHLAKIASQVAKPDGLVAVDPDKELDFLHPLPVGLMWGVGPVTRQRLADIGVLTIGDLSEMPGSSLERLLGHAVGDKLSSLAWNVDPRSIETHHRSRSVGAQSALGRQRISDDLMDRTLMHLADRVATRLRAKDRAGRTVTTRVRFEDLSSVTRSITLPAAISSTFILSQVATELVRSALADHPKERVLTLLAISVSHLADQPSLQLELGLDLGDPSLRLGTEEGAARWQLDRSVDAVRERFGRDAVGYASVALSSSRSVPDEFRELAEKDG